MSNKLVKSKSKRDKELDYYKKHSALLEKENNALTKKINELKGRIAELEMLISLNEENDDKVLDEARILIKKNVIGLKSVEKLRKEYLNRIKILDEELTELSNIKPLYTRSVDKLLKQYEKFMD